MDGPCCILAHFFQSCAWSSQTSERVCRAFSGNSFECCSGTKKWHQNLFPLWWRLGPKWCEQSGDVKFDIYLPKCFLWQSKACTFAIPFANFEKKKLMCVFCQVCMSVERSRLHQRFLQSLTDFSGFNAHECLKRDIFAPMQRKGTCLQWTRRHIGCLFPGKLGKIRRSEVPCVTFTGSKHTCHCKISFGCMRIRVVAACIQCESRRQAPQSLHLLRGTPRPSPSKIQIPKQRFIQEQGHCLATSNEGINCNRAGQTTTAAGHVDLTAWRQKAAQKAVLLCSWNHPPKSHSIYLWVCLLFFLLHNRYTWVRVWMALCLVGPLGFEWCLCSFRCNSQRTYDKIDPKITSATQAAKCVNSDPGGVQQESLTGPTQVVHNNVSRVQFYGNQRAIFLNYPKSILSMFVATSSDRHLLRGWRFCVCLFYCQCSSSIQMYMCRFVLVPFFSTTWGCAPISLTQGTKRTLGWVVCRRALMPSENPRKLW